jgi:hypothetical protein
MEEMMYLAALLLSSPVVSLPCTVGKLMEHCASGLIFLKAFYNAKCNLPGEEASRYYYQAT